MLEKIQIWYSRICEQSSEGSTGCEEQSRELGFHLLERTLLSEISPCESDELRLHFLVQY